MMSMRPSGKSSATIAATFEVPMSRATMRFLFSLAMSDSLARAGLGATALGNAQRKAVGVAQVDIVQTAPGLSECLRVYRHEPRETFVDAVFVRVTSELHAETLESLSCQARRELSRTWLGSRVSGASKLRKAR